MLFSTSVGLWRGSNVAPQSPRSGGILVPSEWDEVFTIAKRVRAALDQFVQGLEGFGPGVTGMCIVGSLALEDALSGRRSRPQVVRGRFAGLGHAWIELDDRVIDITADQFPG